MRGIQYAVPLVRIEMLVRTGYPAGACHRARQRRDPVAVSGSQSKLRHAGCDRIGTAALRSGEAAVF